MKFVVDASILIQAYTRESDTARVQTLLSTLQKSVHIIFVPEFCLLECSNILWKHTQFQGMPLTQAQQAITAMRRLPLIVRTSLSLLPRSLTVGDQYKLAMYDSIYVALAEELNCPLITVDQRQAAAATAVSVALKPITDFAEYTDA